MSEETKAADLAFQDGARAAASDGARAAEPDVAAAAGVVSAAAPHTHSQDHAGEPVHHHHAHSATSKHTHGHHLLQVEDLSIGFDMYAQTGKWTSERTFLSIIHNLNISVHEGEIVAIVGASGSGKTLLADAIMGLYEPNSRVEGTIYFDGELQTPQTLAQVRGREIAFVPQSVKAMNPLMRVGKQIGGSAEKRAELFKQYRLDPSVERMYPHELSGGMARRVLLCTALVTDPKLIIADEPTPGLDLELAVKAMDDFKAFAQKGGGVLLITHDIELALSVADRVAVFRDGTVLEETAVSNFASPDTLEQEFSKNLWRALPEHDFAVVQMEEGWR